jgi:hypothetical protein
MDWFEKLTGFRETSYDDTRAKLKVESRRPHSLINEQSYAIGELDLVSLQALRERVKSAGGLAKSTQSRCGNRRRAGHASVA